MVQNHTPERLIEFYASWSSLKVTTPRTRRRLLFPYALNGPQTLPHCSLVNAALKSENCLMNTVTGDATTV
ncbi:hypothetical protein E2C01_086259 [Portunus trituberculatus]|uniref:Uncharacterized protein n=1 Tax=Portunus trituberculatus TaxID=210409 RepID=A0A5B7J969_PORTR|nr:hypothetical protein [Portunus trituberculatus]